MSPLVLEIELMGLELQVGPAKASEDLEVLHRCVGPLNVNLIGLSAEGLAGGLPFRFLQEIAKRRERILSVLP